MRTEFASAEDYLFYLQELYASPYTPAVMNREFYRLNAEQGDFSSGFGPTDFDVYRCG
jgi:hypothetical protein